MEHLEMLNFVVPQNPNPKQLKKLDQWNWEKKRKQTDGQTGGRTADIRSFMKKVTDQDKTED